MKKIFYLMCCVLTAFLVGCESNEPGGANEQSWSFVAKPFSVSATKTVTFSPANLQYHAANNEWRFAPSQTEYIGEGNLNISPSYNGWIDLFGWGTGNNPTNTSADVADYQTFVDWGVNKISNYAPYTWRTLTSDEWEYIIEKRSNADKLKGIAQVNGVNGLILLPDNWTCPSDITFKPGPYDGAVRYADFQIFNALDWEKLEASGAVFFSATGYRQVSYVSQVQFYGNYWSATSNDYYEANFLLFYPAGAVMAHYDRPDGYSVRLVKD